MIPLVLAVSLALSAPSLVDAFTGRGTVDGALLRLALALVVTSLAARVLRAVVRSYQESAVASARTDAGAPGPGSGDRRRRES